ALLAILIGRRLAGEGHEGSSGVRRTPPEVGIAGRQRVVLEVGRARAVGAGRALWAWAADGSVEDRLQVAEPAFRRPAVLPGGPSDLSARKLERQLAVEHEIDRQVVGDRLDCARIEHPLRELFSVLLSGMIARVGEVPGGLAGEVRREGVPVEAAILAG